MRRSNANKPLTQTEKNRRWEAKHNAKKFHMTFVLSDPVEHELYEFLCQYKSRRKAMLEALKLLKEHTQSK